MIMTPLKKVLITGATGFIGKPLVSYLLNKNLTVRVLIRHPEQKKLFPDTVDTFLGDLTQPESLQGICHHIDGVFHLGGYAHAAAQDEAAFIHQHEVINQQGTKNLLVEAKKANVQKFIFFSSVKAVADSEHCLDETWTQKPHTPYGLAKRAAENMVLAEQDIASCVLRLSLVYGPGWKGNLAAMLRAVDRGIFPPLPEVHNRRSMVSIDDVCLAAFLAATHPNAQGKVYFVTDGVYYSTYQMYGWMRAALGKSIPRWHIPLGVLTWLARIGDLGHRMTGQRLPFNSEALSKLFDSAHYNSECIQQELGFQPTMDFRTMLPSIVAAYRVQGIKNK